ncbi:hypothetical protein WDW37_20825 [Bdellovibrionota bacterium FG-1]
MRRLNNANHAIGFEREQVLTVASYKVPSATGKRGFEHEVVRVIMGNYLDRPLGLVKVRHLKNPMDESLGVGAAKAKFLNQVPLDLFQNLLRGDDFKSLVQRCRDNGGWWSAKKDAANPDIGVNTGFKHDLRITGDSPV